MANLFQIPALSEKSETVLNVESTAVFLGVSEATIRNWVKCGCLQTLEENTKEFFYKKNVEEIRSKILSGDLEKLNRRANKAKAGRTFVPSEYMQDKAGLEDLDSVVEFVKSHNVDLSSALLLIGLNLLKKEKIISHVSIEDITQGKDLPITNGQIKKEMKSWLSEIEGGLIKKDFSFLLDCHIPNQRDTLGFLYQSLLAEGQKSQIGSYYTPSKVVDKIIADYAKKDLKILDPCCGTGQFLLAFADFVENPSNIYGIDSDQIAIRIARLNILIRFKNKKFVPSIVCKNTLFDVGNYDLFSLNDENMRDFDVIATNPPWGAHFSKTDTERLKALYPDVTSFESFSYFLRKSISLLRDGGTISFILPESILNVKTHKDIREFILKNSQIEKIVYLDRVFKNVFTPVIRLDLRKNRSKGNKVKIQKENEDYEVEQIRWLNNQDFVFDIHVNDFDAEIIDKVYKMKNITLENKAHWALGIVTGNNEKFISTEQKEGFEPVYKGKDVGKFTLNSPSNFIRFTPEKFQQVAPIEKYRAKEKLIYKFISKNLVFAYDDKQCLTLNSANVVIPMISNYPMKVIAALLNSSLYQFIFRKKFSSIKVLRSHIEQMPLPLWNAETFSEIIRLVDEEMSGKKKFEKLDDYIMDKFFLSPEEKRYINDFNK